MSYGDSLKTSSVKIQDIKSVLDTLYVSYQYVEATGSINTTSTSSTTMSGTTTGNVVITGNRIVSLNFFVTFSSNATLGRVSLFLMRGATEITSFGNFLYYGDTSGEAYTVCASCIDVTPAAGTYTYNLNWAVASGETGYATNRGLLAVNRIIN
jgi:hypothetical protein